MSQREQEGPTQTVSVTTGADRLSCPDHSPPHASKQRTILARIGSTQHEGLSEGLIARLRTQHGSNRLAPPEPTSNIELLLRQFTGAVVWLLVVATAFSIALRDYAEAAAISVVLVVNAAIGFVAEQRSVR